MSLRIAQTAAEAEGKIRSGDTLIEVTKGNTGIALTDAVKGYKLIIVMGDKVSVERQPLARAYGAEVVIVDSSGGIKGSFDKAAGLIAKYGYFEIKQVENPQDAETHVLTARPEIEDVLGGKITGAFVSDIGTGGRITGMGRYLKKLRPDIKIIAVQVEDSAVLAAVRVAERPGPGKPVPPVASIYGQAQLYLCLRSIL
jgi:cysteine synthase A